MERPKSEPEKHHFVPRAYLKQFCSDGMLYYLNLAHLFRGYNVKVRRKGLMGLCVQNGYYSLSKIPSNQNQPFDHYPKMFIESQVLKDIEDSYPHIFKQLSEYNFITLSMASDFIRFVIQLKKRNPYHEKHSIEKQKMEWINTVGDGIIEKLKNGMPGIHTSLPLEIQLLIAKDIITGQKKDPSLGTKIQLHSLIDDHENSAVSERLYDAFMSKKWVVLMTPEKGPFFITTDNPGYSMEKGNPAVFNTKFVGDFRFYLPLSPRYCFAVFGGFPDECYTASGVKEITRLDIPENTVLEINDNSQACINEIIMSNGKWYLEEVISAYGSKKKD